jgi:hypothetical protein
MHLATSPPVRITPDAMHAFVSANSRRSQWHERLDALAEELRQHRARQSRSHHVIATYEARRQRP